MKDQRAARVKPKAGSGMYGAGFLQEIRDAFVAYGPSLVAAAAILVGGWAIARLAAWGVRAGVDATPLAKAANADRTNGSLTLGAQLADAVFWVILLIALFLALAALGLDAVTAPLQNMLDQTLGAAPNVFGAGLVFFVGAILAGVARRAVSTTLNAAGADALAQRYGFGGAEGSKGASKAVGALVFALVILPIAIAALEILNVEAVTEPAQAMLTSVLVAAPRVIFAALAIVIAVFVGRFAARLVEDTLPALGFDDAVGRLGLIGPGADKGVTPTKFVSGLVMLGVVLVGAVMAARLLDAPVITEMLADVLYLGGRIVFGALIIVAGAAIARLLGGAIAATGGAGADAAGLAVRIGVIVLSAAIGLRHMGLANEIINAAFMITLGACGVAAALAFGLGGRDAARRVLDRWTKTDDDQA